jgi:hypothetical protein
LEGYPGKEAWQDCPQEHCNTAERSDSKTASGSVVERDQHSIVQDYYMIRVDVSDLNREPKMYGHVLIATDGSEFSEQAVVEGAKLAKALGSKATVVTAVQTPV